MANPAGRLAIYELVDFLLYPDRRKKSRAMAQEAEVPHKLPSEICPAPNTKLWVQLSGYPAWPCIVRDPDAHRDVIGTDVPNRPRSRGSDSHFLVQWYGTGQVSWINARTGNCWIFNGRTDEFAKRVLKKMQSQYDNAIAQACAHDPDTTIDTDYDSVEDRPRDETEEPDARHFGSSGRGGMDALTSAAAAAEAAPTSPRGRSSSVSRREAGRKRSRSEGGRGRGGRSAGDDEEGDDASGQSEGGPSARGEAGAGGRCGLGLLALPDSEFEALLHMQARNPPSALALARRLARLARALASGLDAFRASAAAQLAASSHNHESDPRPRADSEVRALASRLRTEEESRYKVQELLGVERQERSRLEEEVRVLRSELARARQREQQREQQRAAAGPSIVPMPNGIVIKREGNGRAAAAATAVAAAAAAMAAAAAVAAPGGGGGGSESDTETDTDGESGEASAGVRTGADAFPACGVRRRESREQIALGAG
eukprot:tig00001208_g7525.t2